MNQSSNTSMTVGSLDSLIARLDKSFDIIRQTQAVQDKPVSEAMLTELESQGVIYAGFLSDAHAGRINPFGSAAREMMRLVGAFCQLVETELPLKLV